MFLRICLSLSFFAFSYHWYLFIPHALDLSRPLSREIKQILVGYPPLGYRAISQKDLFDLRKMRLFSWWFRFLNFRFYNVRWDKNRTKFVFDTHWILLHSNWTRSVTKIYPSRCYATQGINFHSSSLVGQRFRVVSNTH